MAETMSTIVRDPIKNDQENYFSEKLNKPDIDSCFWQKMERRIRESNLKMNIDETAISVAKTFDKVFENVLKQEIDKLFSVKLNLSPLNLTEADKTTPISSLALNENEILLIINRIRKIRLERLKFEKRRMREEKLINEISEISTKLMHLTNNEEKVRLIVHLNSHLKENEELIKKKYPDILASILDSL